MIDSTLKNANILIVDDQEANLLVLSGFLEMQGFSNIKTTQDPRDVVHLMSAFNPDLILLDLSMPFLSGFEVMDQIKSLISDTTFLPILVLTADVSSSAKLKALSGGASDFLTKPFDLIEVGMRIKNLLYVSYLQYQLQNQNQILEQKVKERTLELEAKNIDLITAKEKAEASDRLKTVFINNISHEIRTPLNGILGFAQILMDNDLSYEEKEQYSEMLNESCDRLLNTVTNFFDISLLTSGNQKVSKKRILIRDIVREVISQFKIICNRKNISLLAFCDQQCENIATLADGNLLGKILHQLISNSVKFTNEGSITISYELDHPFLKFSVKDTGIGISDKCTQQIFDVFMQEDYAVTRKFEGSGLGLSIAQMIVKLLGGSIWLESEKGKGSMFYFTIPYEHV
jgi:two-component system, sensor histidine kinase and response regulator